MTHQIRTHIGTAMDETPRSGLAPVHLRKQDFGRRLYRLMIEAGMRQSDLARAAGLSRDSISTYINGRSTPTPENLEKLAKALDVAATDLLANYVESAIDKDIPSLELKVSTANPRTAWLRVNRLVSTETAIKISQLLNDDKPSVD